MLTLRNILDNSTRTLSVLLGVTVLSLAVTMFMTQYNAADIMNWAREVLGGTFVVLLSGLVFLSLYAWVQLLRTTDADGATTSDDVWLETGMQAANGVATLALTFTLLGISLGIGTLAGQELTPETVQPVIRKMTANFSLAFMTTVVGLPAAAFLRALLSITHTRRITASAVQVLPPRDMPRQFE